MSWVEMTHRLLSGDREHGEALSTSYAATSYLYTYSEWRYPWVLRGTEYSSAAAKSANMPDRVTLWSKHSRSTGGINRPSKTVLADCGYLAFTLLDKLLHTAQAGITTMSEFGR